MQPRVDNQPRPASWMFILAFALVYIAWGTTYLALKVGVQIERIPPALFGGTRVTTAGVILLLYQLLRGDVIWLSRRDFGAIALTGAVMFIGGNGLLSVGQTTLDSGAAAVLAATAPLWIALFGLFWPDADRLNWRGWLGLLIGLLGVLFLFGPKVQQPERLFRDPGPWFVLGSAASWALGTLLSRHHRPNCSHLTTAAWQMTLGGGALILVAFALGEPERMPEQITWNAVIAFLYLLVAGSFVGFIAYNWLLGHASAAEVGTHSYVNPAVAVMIGWLSGEPFTLWLGGGIIVILAGVALVRNSERRPLPDEGSSAAAVADAVEETAVVAEQRT